MDTDLNIEEHPNWYMDVSPMRYLILGSFPPHPTKRKYSFFYPNGRNSNPMELTINFPADSFAIFHSPGSYLKLFLLPDTMTLEKEPLYNYGVTGLKSFLDTSFHKPTILQKTIKPKDACLFYVAMVNSKAGGMVRAGLVLKEQDLYYKFSVDRDSH